MPAFRHARAAGNCSLRYRTYMYLERQECYDRLCFVFRILVPNSDQQQESPTMGRTKGWEGIDAHFSCLAHGETNLTGNGSFRILFSNKLISSAGRSTYLPFILHFVTYMNIILGNLFRTKSEGIKRDRKSYHRSFYVHLN